MNYSWRICKSTLWVRFLYIIYLLSVSAIFLNALPLVIKIGIAIVVIFHAYKTIKKFQNENWQLDFDDENGWQILESSTIKSLEILPSTVLTRWCIFLHYKIENKTFYRLISKDSILPDINDFRQLFVTLKTYQ